MTRHEEIEMMLEAPVMEESIVPPVGERRQISRLFLIPVEVVAANRWMVWFKYAGGNIEHVTLEDWMRLDKVE